MSIWPFGRKDSRRKGGLGLKVAATEPTMSIQRTGSQREIGRQNGNEGGTTGIARKRTGRDRRRQSQESNKLQRDPRRRNYSFSPGRSETLGISRDAHRQHPVPPIPDNAAAMKGKSAMGTITNSGAKGGRLQDNGVERVPTLHKRSAQDMNRRKSSKKRKEDHDRAAEIKAMSKMVPPPSRASTTPEWSGRPMKRDTKKMHGVSDVSLPIPESLHSSMSSDSERYTSYKLRGMGLFAPHPTIRYTDNPRYKHHESGLSLDRSNSKRKRAMEKESIPEEILTSRMRIDDLADNLDAGGLRELMEREDRRLERKKLDDQQRVARRVAKRKEMQKAAEEEAMLRGNDRPKNMDRGVMGRELMGLDIDTADSSKVTRRGSNASSERRQRVADTARDTVESTAQSADFVRSESLPGTEPGSPTGDLEEPVIAIAQLARLSRASMSPPTSPPKGPTHRRNESGISQIQDLPPPPRMLEAPPTEASLREDASVEMSKTDTARRSFDTGGSSSKQQSSWKSWFKRNSRERRLSAHSSFSNTTRESIISNQPPPVVYQTPLTSTIPKRTMSRFREDLPELPISPPSSRVQSPEAFIVPVTPRNTSRVENNDGGREPIDIPSALRRHDVLFGGGHRSHLRYETPSSVERRSTEVPSPDMSNFMSQSLASIDSEGSWLSGRPRANSKRSSCQHPLSQPRESHSSLQKRHGESSDSAEELGIAEDEYYSRLTPGPDEMYNNPDQQKRVSGNPMASSDEDYQSVERPRTPELNSKWGDVARRPTVVHRQSRAVSTQGLVNDFLDEDFDDDETVGSPQTANYRDDDSEAADSLASPTRVQRALSVDYKKERMTHISAGSAKLLNLKPRPSGESKRASLS